MYSIAWFSNNVFIEFGGLKKKNNVDIKLWHINFLYFLNVYCSSKFKLENIFKHIVLDG